MNRPIRHVAGFVGLLFIALLANITVNNVVRTEDLTNDVHNRRVRDAEFYSYRGDIMVGATAIATTKKLDGPNRYQRIYSDGEMYAPITGYYSYNYGSSGLEQLYSAELSGTADSQMLYRLQNLLANQQVQGANLHTTINAKAQAAAWNGIKDKKGAVVAIDYTTGAILALASSPSYDPTLLSSADLKSANQAWQKLSKDTNKPLLNRGLREIYPPGSTFKLVVSAAALGAGNTPETVLDSPESLKLPGTTHTITNESYCGGDKSSMRRALQVSCNTAFSNLGISLGADSLRAQAQKFGFGTQIKSDVYSAVSKFPNDLDVPQLAMSSIGQFDVAATPIQMAMVAAAVANHGVLMEPYLVQEIRNSDLTLLSSHRPKEFSKPMNPANADQLRDMMITVVNNGTGQRAKISGVTVGGKTGTAQNAVGKKPYAWFVGFADDPKVAIAVFVEDTNGTSENISGGGICAPIFRNVVQAMR